MFRCDCISGLKSFCLFFFFNDTATTEIYTLSLHDALPISARPPPRRQAAHRAASPGARDTGRSEEHTSELQSHLNLVCRLLLEKKKKKLAVKEEKASTAVLHIFASSD